MNVAFTDQERAVLKTGPERRERAVLDPPVDRGAAAPEYSRCLGYAKEAMERSATHA